MSAGKILLLQDGRYEVCRYDPTGESDVLSGVDDKTPVAILAKDRAYEVAAGLLIRHLTSKDGVLGPSIDAVLRENIIKVEGTTS